MDNPGQQSVIAILKEKIASHHLKSGEVILLYDEADKNITEVSRAIEIFCTKHTLKIYPAHFKVTEISHQQAVNSIKYGLSTKPNYTSVGIEFSASAQNQIVYSFLQLFNNPRFYSIDSKLYQTALDLDDFWESGGAIVIDKHSIGILWVNDLYDKFQ